MKPRTPKPKTAILLNAMPLAIQDYVFQQMGKEPTYSEVKDLIKRYVTRKAESNGPTLMDVGNMQYLQQNQQQRQPCGHEDNGWQEEDGDAYRYPWDMNMWDHLKQTHGAKRRLGKKTTPLHSKVSMASKMQSVMVVAPRAT